MTINCRGKLIDLAKPCVMGILNVTPDSFFDGGKYESEKSILNRAEIIIEEGAAFIDMGGYSSRPNASDISADEEMQRIVPAIETVIRHFPDASISVDTFRSSIAKACIEAGASIVNDISAGLLDDQMLETVSKLKVPYIMMHMRGTPQTMQQFTAYDDLISDVLFYFSERISAARKLGIGDIIIDPGFGFAKTTEQNYELMQKLQLLNIGLPILVGVSRKGMVYKVLETNAEGSLNGTTALHMAALMKGAKILRVHDVKAAIECVRIYNAMQITDDDRVRYSGS